MQEPDFGPEEERTLIASRIVAREPEHLERRLSEQDALRFLDLGRRLSARQEGLFDYALAEDAPDVPFNSMLLAMARSMKQMAVAALQSRPTSPILRVSSPPGFRG